MHSESWQKFMAWGRLDHTAVPPLRHGNHPALGVFLGFGLRVQAFAARQDGKGIETISVTVPCVLFGEGIRLFRPILQESLGFQKLIQIEGQLTVFEQQLVCKVEYLVRVMA